MATKKSQAHFLGERKAMREDTLGSSKIAANLPILRLPRIYFMYFFTHFREHSPLCTCAESQ